MRSSLSNFILTSIDLFQEKSCRPALMSLPSRPVIGLAGNPSRGLPTQFQVGFSLQLAVPLLGALDDFSQAILGSQGKHTDLR
ncbi:MAG: hypothetical protein ACK5HY_00885, partial [Parahaliea sp.]